MSRFHRYSVNNQMLIHMQRPDATHVAGFNKWRDQLGRSVKRGEKGIKIIAPTPFKKKVEEMKLDPDTKAPLLDKDGNAIMEEKEIQIPMFKVVTVFDVAQTAGKPLPQLASDLTGDVKQYEVFMEALRRSSPVLMELRPIQRDTDGYFSRTDQNIIIREGMSEVQTVSTAVHIQRSDEGYDYTIYNKETLREIDGGRLDMPDIPISAACLQVCKLHDMGNNSIKYASLDILDQIQEAEDRQQAIDVAEWECQNPPSPFDLPAAPTGTGGMERTGQPGECPGTSRHPLR